MRDGLNALSILPSVAQSLLTVSTIGGWLSRQFSVWTFAVEEDPLSLFLEVPSDQR